MCHVLFFLRPRDVQHVRAYACISISDTFLILSHTFPLFNETPTCYYHYCTRVTIIITIIIILAPSLPTSFPPFSSHSTLLINFSRYPINITIEITCRAEKSIRGEPSISFHHKQLESVRITLDRRLKLWSHEWETKSRSPSLRLRVLP